MKNSYFTEKDIQQIKDRGSELSKVEEQIERFKNGFPYTFVVEPATVENGIKVLSDAQKEELAAYFDQNKGDFSIQRFIPASGAATRMFKDLFTLREELKGKSRQKQLEQVKESGFDKKFFDVLDKYPFYRELKLTGAESPDKILDALLGEKGLNYGSLPKGMISFHSYGEISRTAFEEQLHEAARLCGSGETVNVHFTVSEEHLSGFKSIEKSVVPALESIYEVTYKITYSFQKKSTDTIAVNMNNEPFRDQNGHLVFRPGGHGALIENLNDLQSDVLFLNNIDNVSPDANSENRILHKKMLGGLLLRYESEIELLIESVAKASESDENSISHAVKWLENITMVEIKSKIDSFDLATKKTYLLDLLDRPLRVCGMVKNEGDPGGGPFFSRDTNGNISLQIVEKSQIDLDDHQQSKLLSRSSHFNPVDIVCRVRRKNGKKYNLPDYVDPETGFISKKSVRGKDLKALELPGLWNGSMADWLTVFVEVPSSTFTPVKTIFDLLKPSHHM